MLDFLVKELKVLSVWENIKVVLCIMDSGLLIQEMDGVFLKIKLLGIDMLEVGSKTENMASVDNKILPPFMKVSFTKIKNKDLES